LFVEFDVELGEGYREAESADNLPIGIIPIDAVFTPIRKVNFNVEAVHIGREINRERLNIEVWTDGTISPVDAISNSADLLIEQLAPFSNYNKVSKVKTQEDLIRLSIPDEKYNKPIEELDLSVRTLNSLRRGGISTVGEIISKGEKELLSLRNFGLKSKHEIDESLAGMGLSLSPQVEESEGEDQGEA